MTKSMVIASAAKQSPPSISRRPHHVYGGELRECTGNHDSCLLLGQMQEPVVCGRCQTSAPRQSWPTLPRNAGSVEADVGEIDRLPFDPHCGWGDPVGEFTGLHHTTHQ